MTVDGNSVDRARAALRAAGHPDTIEEFPDGTPTAQDAAAAVGSTVAQIAKSIMLRADDEAVLIIASGIDRVDTAKIAALLAGRWVRDVTGFAIGGVALVGHLSPPRIFIGEDLMALDLIWAAAGSPRHLFRTIAKALAHATGGQVADVRELSR